MDAFAMTAAERDQIIGEWFDLFKDGKVSVINYVRVLLWLDCTEEQIVRSIHKADRMWFNGMFRVKI